MKSVTKFSGGGGVDLGMIAASWEHSYGIEYDDRIAQVARNNGLNTITADILAIKPEDYPSMDWMHDSPPCPNFSTAKANGEETENDIALAQAVCDWIAYHRPQYYTLENVYGYRLSKSWAMIADTLSRHGYSFNYWHVNMADYGVPQTRKRMIVIARLDGKTPHLPKKTHDENPVPGLFGTLNRWVSWYEAIEDLIPTLPESQFAPWQLERLPDELCTQLVHGTNANGITSNEKEKPAAVVVASLHSKAVMPRAFIMNAANPNGNETKKYRMESEPVKTITAGDSGYIKAFVVPGGNASSFSIRDDTEPIRAIAAVGRIGNVSRAYTGGRVVKMTPRAIARFQSFPDTYALPDNPSLAVRILGNAVPPLFMQRVGEMFASEMAAL